MSDPREEKPATKRDSRCRAWLEIVRISNAPTLLSNVAAGLCLSCADINIGALAGLSLIMLCFYSAGMMLNDLWDKDVDAVERPERPLPSGRLTRRSVAIAATLLFLLGLAALARTPALPAGLLLTAMIVSYNRWHRNNPMAPFLMGACRGIIYLIAAHAACGLGAMTLALGAGMMIYIAAVTQLAAGEASTGHRLSRPAAAVAAVIPLLLISTAWREPMAMALGGVFLAWVLNALRPAWRDSQTPIGPCIGKLLAGLCLFDGVIVAQYGRWEFALLPLFCMVAVTGLHRAIKGT